MESRDEAAPSHRTWKTPPNHHPRFPQLPQPLLLEKKARQRKTKPQRQHPDTVSKLSSMSPVSVLDVPVGSGRRRSMEMLCKKSRSSTAAPLFSPHPETASHR